jgi:F0F1-type ATP synthase membrane subunit b/b'
MPLLTLVTILLYVSSAALFGLLVILVVMSIRNGAQMQKLTYPVYDYIVKKEEHEAQEVLKRAQKEAEELVQSAQESGHEVIALYTKKAEEAREQYGQSLSTLTNSLEKKLEHAQDAGEASLQELFEHMQKTLAEHKRSWQDRSDAVLGELDAVASMLEKRTRETLSRIDTDLQSVKETFSHTLRERIEKQDEVVATHLRELSEAAEVEIISYKKARLSILDARIERLVEEVAKQVLCAELSSAEHASLAREALEEAKAHNLL